MKTYFKISLTLLISLMISCSDDDNSGDNISNQILQGQVFGNDFTALGGKAFDSGEDISVNITNIVADCESSVLDYDLEISTYVTPEVGVYEGINVVFNKEGEAPYNYLDATVEVTSLTETEITVKIKADSSSDKTVEGTFTVPYCQ
ncbi:hypothetical protein [Algibacter lectus]|uniref:Uncharacterized protein n=1 Tax=Algibacter lectus TaxID=221126 RepID=A0A090VCC4_9FLAO|nr:hypothetical protein [Algibacter lectus]MDO7137900.1 hypothetical protein [Algibacter lectus]MWW26131.1 hypothetical protein [Algibacter lectus]TDY60393.1 hypothetical protein DFQ06_3526 [Algibacter lectus]SFD37301.1 hypothetical protein SAMN04489722_108147 [Algibacter lectus]GAL62416.1 hypothetical protein JCM19300_2469 [Algibacter lectus]